MFLALFSLIFLALLSGFLMLWTIPEAHRKESRNQGRKNVSVIIPARNEAINLPKLLASLKKQRVQPLEILVIDDHSEDDTAQIAHAYGAKVITSETLDETEWIGKSAACWRGAETAEGEWFLFLDADTAFVTEDSFERLLSTYETRGATGILSLQPFHHLEEAYENLSVVFNVILMAGMNVFTPLGEDIEPAGSFGPCILVTRKEYFRTNGHKAVSNAIMDDLALGENFREHNLPVRCYSGRGVIQFRMYAEGMSQLVEGWTKGFGTAAQSTHPGVMALISLWISGAFITSGTLLLSLFLEQPLLSLATLLCCLIYMGQFYWQARRIGSFHILTAVFYPVMMLFFVGLFLRSLFFTKIMRKVKWRGRDIQV